MNVKALVSYLPDALAVVGLSLLSVGLWRVNPTYFFIGIGALLLLLGFWLSLGQKSNPAKGSTSKG